MVLPTTTVTEHSRGKPKLGPPSQQCKTPQVRFLQHTHEGATRRHQEWLMLLHRWSIFYRRLRHHRTKKHVATASKPSSSSSLFPFNQKKTPKIAQKRVHYTTVLYHSLSSCLNSLRCPQVHRGMEDSWKECHDASERASLLAFLSFVCLFVAHFCFAWIFGVLLPIFWSMWTGDHPQEEWAKFGERYNKIQIWLIPSKLDDVWTNVFNINLVLKKKHVG